MNITRRSALKGMTAAAIASPLGIGVSIAAAAETDAPLLAMIEEAGAVDYRSSVAQYDRICALFEQIETTPAKTLEGVMAKLRCLDHQFRTGQIEPVGFAASALADLERLAGEG